MEFKILNVFCEKGQQHTKRVKQKIRPKLIIALICYSSFIFSQEFKRVEYQTGLDLLEGNIGVSVADFDGDNDLDLFVVSKYRDVNNDEKTKSKLYRNNNDGTYTDVTTAAGLANLHPYEDGHLKDLDNIIPDGYTAYKWGASWGDYDNDGDPDLFFTNTYRVQLFENLGDGTFANATESVGITSFNNCFNTTALWFDFDKDGYLDLFIGDYASSCGKNTLYKNNGNGTFKDVSNLLDDVNASNRESFFTFMAVPIDVNNDGWLDLYIANDFGRNDLLINENGTKFSEQSSAYNLDDDGTGMALSIGDYDNNGIFDIYLSNTARNSLFSQNVDNTYTDKALEQGVAFGTWAWASRFADFDLDTDEDLLLVNGDKRGYNYNLYFKNLLNEGESNFVDKSAETNIKELTYSMATKVFDFDNDGDLDIFISNRNKESFFYENKTITGATSNNLHWFKVKLQGTVSNRDAIGTKISIKTESGTYYRYHHGSSLYSQSLQAVHFGVGSDTKIQEVKITWPSGTEETHTNIDADNTILAIEGQGYQVLNIAPSNVVSGCTNPASCNYNPLALIDDGSCTFLDSKSIVGNTTSTFFNTETYTYPISNSSEITWQVIGGEIISGENTQTISVKWGIENIGKVIATEVGSQCSSMPVKLVVNLVKGEIFFNDKVSIARLWNEALLQAIREDYARPTVHARNLFHTSIVMYDAWAIYSKTAKPYLIGSKEHAYKSELKSFTPLEEQKISRDKAISYASYRLLSHRFKDSPNANKTLERFNLLMSTLDFDPNYTSVDYSTGNAAALGNYIAETIIAFGFTDGAREETKYDNGHYQPLNSPLVPNLPGSGSVTDPNRWQPLSLDVFIDQSGNQIIGTTPEFLNPEWGDVTPFSLTENDKTEFIRDGNIYKVYHNPQNPPYLDLNVDTDDSDIYKWGNSLVSIWGSHLDPKDNVMWDISPNTVGNIDIESFPTTFNEYPDFYNTVIGGDISKGYTLNPITNSPYEKQMVPRGDFTRVLAEFWADGPDSETPPGHWFTLLNHVSDHPLLKKKMNGVGEELDELEWDVKSYFILGGTMHDAAIAAWSIKGWHDYVRPISAIRFMADMGQSTDPSKSNYNIAGIPLKDGYVEIIEAGDALEGRLHENIGKIKLYTWKGPNYIGNPKTDNAGVGWILAENWWPYQRPSFVTPPFAGFVSGHSTYSRAAAEVMTLLTGDSYFPGGYGEFIAKKDEFLVFENGPSVDIKLQWATYRDASDQCSLSRIWGGIHPPVDDIPGRLIGEKIGVDAFNFATSFFNGKQFTDKISVYPNPSIGSFAIYNSKESDNIYLLDINGRKISIKLKQYNSKNKTTTIKLPNTLSAGIYILKINETSKKIILQKQ